MTIDELRKALEIQGGAIHLTRGMLGDGFDALLLSAFQGQGSVIAVTEASLAQGGPSDRVVITGRSGFLNAADLPLKATFWLDQGGQVQAVLSYRLRDASPSGKAWTFSSSFPDLPKVIDYGNPLIYDGVTDFDVMDGQTSYLDHLDLYESYFAVSTTDGIEPDLDLPLKAGINFLSKMRPTGELGVLEYSLADSAELVLLGMINLPTPSSRLIPLRVSEYAWDHPEAPGIHLEADLGIQFKLGKLGFGGSKFRVYSPPSSAWLKENPTYRPIHGYCAKLSVPSAGIEVDRPRTSGGTCRRLFSGRIAMASVSAGSRSSWI